MYLATKYIYLYDRTTWWDIYLYMIFMINWIIKWKTHKKYQLLLQLETVKFNNNIENIGLPQLTLTCFKGIIHKNI
jgi:hypothetical protein